MPPVDLDGMRANVRKACGFQDASDPDLIQDEIDLYLNMAYWEVMDKFPFREKERAGEFETVIGVRNYEIPEPVEAVRQFAVVDPISSQHLDLDQMDARETEHLYSEAVEARGMPRKYLLENCYVRFWPTPDKVYAIVIRKWTILKDIVDSGLPIPKPWIEIVEAGAKYRAFADLGDLQRANYWEKYQARKIDTMVPREQKEIVDYQHAGVFPLRGRHDDSHNTFRGHRW